MAGWPKGDESPSLPSLFNTLYRPCKVDVFLLQRVLQGVPVCPLSLDQGIQRTICSLDLQGVKKVDALNWPQFKLVAIRCINLTAINFT